MKQRIDHSNYEAWLLDRLEGNLTAEQETLLEAFLLAHPELRPDDEDLPSLSETNDRLSALDKEALKRALPPRGLVDERSLEDHLIGRLEGDLDGAQREALRLYLIAHPEHQRVERIYAMTKQAPEVSAFAGKQDLRRELPPMGLVNEHTLHDHLVAKLEGDLMGEQLAALDAYLAAHEPAAREWRIFQQTRVAAVPVVFSGKQDLKREARVIPLFSYRVAMRWAAAAAVLAFLLTMWWMVEPSAPQLADQPKAPVTNQQPNVDQEPEPNAQDPQAVAPIVVSASGDTNAASFVKREQPSAPVRVEPIPEAQLAQDRLIAEDHGSSSVEKETPQVPLTADQHHPLAQAAPSAVQAAPQTTGTPASDARTLGEALAGVVREKVLERPTEEKRPLDGDDALAAVDRGLRALGGDKAGLAVQRDERGRGQGFALRLGRNLAVTASR